jgi:hypothetical protein
MISLKLAQQLKKAGLVWQTSVNDFFGVPDRGLDDKVFVISDLMVTMELVRGWPALTFHGTAEWASDYLLTHEAVWMPTEEQLREELLAHLRPDGRDQFQLTYKNHQFECYFEFQGQSLSFFGQTVSKVYAQSLLHVLQQTPA